MMYLMVQFLNQLWESKMKNVKVGMLVSVNNCDDGTVYMITAIDGQSCTITNYEGIKLCQWNHHVYGLKNPTKPQMEAYILQLQKSIHFLTA